MSPVIGGTFSANQTCLFSTNQMTHLLVQVNEQVATITLNRPQAANSLSSEMAKLLIESLEKFAKNDDVRCVVITGAGKYFCSGMDLSGKGGSLDPDLFFKTLLNFPKPLIAKVNGPAFAGGWYLPSNLHLGDWYLPAIFESVTMMQFSPCRK
jgi:enoyl-CoA hydratase/carnithine racemase